MKNDFVYHYLCEHGGQMTFTVEKLKKKYHDEAMNLPKETRVKFMEAIKRGKTIGESKIEAGIDHLDLGVACAIIEMNIGNVAFLKEEII